MSVPQFADGRKPPMDGIGEYTECAVVDTQQVMVLQYGGVGRVANSLISRHI